jgi:hypothetical protein
MVSKSALRSDCPLHPGSYLELVSVSGFADLRGIARLEGLGQLKNPMTPSGIEPTTSKISHYFIYNF